MINFEKLSSPKRILLIEPPFYRLFGYKRYHYPISLTLVGAYLEELGHNVKIYDADKPTAECKEYTRSEAGENYYRYEEAVKNLNHPVWEEIKSAVIEYGPEIVGITGSITAKIDSANLIAKFVKELYADKVQVVLGGVHVGAMLSMYPDYDFGEHYDDICAYIPDFISRKPNKRLIIDYDKYEPQNYFSIWTSVGCPNNCTFCTYSLNNKVTFRSIESVKSELYDLKNEYGRAFPVYFIDDSFISYTKRFYEISSVVKSLGMKFKAGGRIMDLSLEKIDKFIENGGERIYIGVESGSQRILDLIKKRLTVEEAVKRTKWLNEAGLEWSAFFIAGFPFETIDDLKMTEELIHKIKPTFVSLNRFAPYPGTQIYKDHYLNSNIRFMDMFQLNNKNYTQLDDKVMNYIEKMFKWADEYNKEKKNEISLKSD